MEMDPIKRIIPLEVIMSYSHVDDNKMRARHEQTVGYLYIAQSQNPEKDVYLLCKHPWLF